MYARNRSKSPNKSNFMIGDYTSTVTHIISPYRNISFIVGAFALLDRFI